MRDLLIVVTIGSAVFVLGLSYLIFALGNLEFESNKIKAPIKVQSIDGVQFVITGEGLLLRYDEETKSYVEVKQ